MRGRESGFALIAALLAVWILTAVGMLVYSMTSQDVRISSRMVGEKKAFFATEAGVHELTRGFDPFNLTDASKYDKDVYVNTGLDAYTHYRISPPVVPTSGPMTLTLIGHSVGGQQQWGSTRFVTTVMGSNTKYGSTVQVDVGVGFGPVEITTAYR
jgi:Tfp pilus assembly protein PilX